MTSSNDVARCKPFLGGLEDCGHPSEDLPTHPCSIHSSLTSALTKNLFFPLALPHRPPAPCLSAGGALSLPRVQEVGKSLPLARGGLSLLSPALWQAVPAVPSLSGTSRGQGVPVGTQAWEAGHGNRLFWFPS